MGCFRVAGLSELGIPHCHKYSEMLLGWRGGSHPVSAENIWALVLVQVTIYRRLRIGLDDHLDQSEVYVEHGPQLTRNAHHLLDGGPYSVVDGTPFICR